MARKSLSARRAGKLAQLGALKAKIAEMEDKAARRLGKLALRAGLADLDLKEDELLRGFKAMADRFRGGAAETGPGQGAQTAEPGPKAREQNRHGR